MSLVVWQCFMKVIMSWEASFNCVYMVLECAVMTSFPFFVYLVAEILKFGWPKLNSMLVRSVAMYSSSF